MFEAAEQALQELGVSLTDVMEEEPDMALGNGGLGRLAACYIDSLAAMEYPALGYGLHYEHGLFRQEIKSGAQIERPDSWRDYGNPWEICRPESIQEILYGYVETKYGQDGRIHKEWHPGSIVKGLPWDIPIVGYGGNTVNVLRLWESQASDYFNWDVFNAGGYIDSHTETVQAETISKVLYPNDETEAGKELRLIQQYFFCACSLKDIIRRYKRAHGDDWSRFSDQVVIQLNDTHPAIAIPELMRILVDRAELDWAISSKVFRLHQPHVVAGSTGKMACRDDRACFTAPFRESFTRLTTALCRGRQNVAQQCCKRETVDHRRRRRTNGSHGAFECDWLVRRERRSRNSLAFG